MSDRMELEDRAEEVVESAYDAQDGQEEAEETTGQPQGDRQPQAEDRFADLDLDDLPKFRKWKSQMDKQMAAVRQQMTAAERRAWDAEQRNQQIQMQGMDELQRAQFQNHILNQQLQQMQERERQMAYAYQKDQDLREAAYTLDLDYDELAEALPEGADNHVMWKTALKLSKAKGGSNPTQAQVRKAQRAANQVDTGSSQPAPVPGKWQKMYDEAKASFDTDKMLDAMAGAGREGVELKE